MRTQFIIDDYITKEPLDYAVGSCEHCGELVYNGDNPIEINGMYFCDEECVKEYYEVEELSSIIYCDECNEAVEETYIKDVYGNTFCDLDCLIKYYK